MTTPARETVDAIVDASSAAGIRLHEEAAAAMALHLELVYQAGEEQNLTRIPVDLAPTLHVLDSLAGLASMFESGPGDWADIGSGAGFPGIPLCVAGGRHVDMIESVGKKSRFLSTAVAALRLDATVRACRAEEAAHQTPTHYASVSARAVGQLFELAELAAPLLRMGGVLVAWKGSPEAEELRRGEAAGRITGLAMRQPEPYGLPGTDVKRTLVVFVKVAEPRIALPRRPGLARSRPLA